MNKPTIYKEERPWGSFTRFTLNEISTVKIIDINPNESLSLQNHQNRSEFWKVISGTGKVQIESQLLDYVEGQEFFVKAGEKHRIISGDSPVKILEIAFGNFDENDIKRFDDKYGREVLAEDKNKT